VIEAEVKKVVWVPEFEAIVTSVGIRT